MLTINTIAEFLALPIRDREEIQKAIRTKDRFDTFLASKNHRIGDDRIIEPHWDPCKRCEGSPGWVWRGDRRDNSDVHPSQISKCVKFLYYSCAGYADKLEEFIDPRLRLVFDNGHAWHEILQKYGKQGAWCAPDDYVAEAIIEPDALLENGQPANPLAHKYWIKGHVDAVISGYVIEKVPSLGTVSIRLIHEYKSIKTSEYSKLTRPKPEHKYQATIYAAVLDVPIVVYLYINKDDSRIIDYPVPFDNTIWDEIVKKIEVVQKYINLDVEPEWSLTSATLNPSECERCGFRSTCQPPLKQLRKGP